MSLIVRRIFFYLLLFIFAIVAPTITAYTAGYRYSFSQKRVVKIGALSVTSLPQGANIELNRKATNKTTPSLMVNLMPGIYTITLKKEGYFEWTKTLAVDSEQTTFTHDITLFKIADPKFREDISKLELEPKIASFKQYKTFYDASHGKIVVINNEINKRVLELPGVRARWSEKPEPTLFISSSNEVWQWSPKENKSILVTRLIGEIIDVLPLPKTNALLLIQTDRIRAIELDLRDNQNTWELANFDEIKNAVLAQDGKTLFLKGIREKKAGIWELQLF